MFFSEKTHSYPRGDGTPSLNATKIFITVDKIILQLMRY